MRILHVFNWRLKDVIPELDNIRSKGFEGIQISPIQPSKDEQSKEWWMQYQPISFTIGNKFGSKQDLINLCQIASTKGIKIICDVVLNHVASADDGSIVPHHTVPEEIRNNPNFWKSFDKIQNWENRHEVITKSPGLPTFNLRNHELQDMIIRFLNELIDCGVRGFRFDCAKNIELPEEGSDFWIRVLGNLKHQEELFTYAEVIFADKGLIDTYGKYIKVLTDSYGSNKERIVAFIDSHDLCHEFKITTKMTEELLNQEYRYLTELYPHTLYYVRDFSDSWRRI